MNAASPEESPRDTLLAVRNHQRDCRIDAVRLRRLVRHHVENQLGLTRYDLAIHLVPARRMAEANARFLQHEGPTDVITFDYGDTGGPGLHGELLICPAVAREQARTYGTTWESETVRYIIHGLLHLGGYDDRTPTDRRAMRREEDRLLRALSRTHPPAGIRARPGPRSKRPLE